VNLKSFPKATHDKRQFFPAFNKDEYSKKPSKEEDGFSKIVIISYMRQIKDLF